MFGDKELNSAEMVLANDQRLTANDLLTA